MAIFNWEIISVLYNGLLFYESLNIKKILIVYLIKSETDTLLYLATSSFFDENQTYRKDWSIYKEWGTLLDNLEPAEFL